MAIDPINGRPVSGARGYLDAAPAREADEASASASTAAGSGASSASGASAPAGSSSIHLSEQTRAALALAQSGSVSEARADEARIDALRRQIAEGSYKPNSRAIASSLLQEAADASYA